MPAGGPLSGVDVAVVGAGPWGHLTGTYLGEYGARVLRIEHPSGDPLRRARWGDGADDASWSVVARGGRGLTCDLGDPAAAPMAAALLAAVDIVVDGEGGRWTDRLVRPGRAGTGPVTVGVSALDDPRAPAGPGDGLLAAAAGGLLHLTGHPTSPPVRVGSDVVEHLAASFACQAALAALLAGARGAPGPTDARVSGEAAARRVLEWTIAAHSAVDRIRVREGNHPSAVAPLGLYTTADGALVTIVGASEANFGRLVAAMGRPELLDDPRYAGVTARAEHAAEVNGEVAAWAAGLPLAEVVRRCLDGGVLVGPVRTVSDLLTDPHVVARGDIVPWPLAGGSAAPQPAPQPATDLHVDAGQPAPALGEADDELWPALAGVDAAQLAALRAQGVVAP